MAESIKKADDERTIYYRKGDRNYPAHRVGNPKKDKCGQTPWKFIAGEWKGKIIMVDPIKMWPSHK